MEVTYFVYPEHLSYAIEDFNVTVEMLAFFASVFGEYPFITEKYGMAVFPWGGGMEHQTLTSYGAGLIRGTHRYDYLNAHEIAHQWFGDCITMRHWSDIWLNEGFASYAEALWFEHLGGEDAYYNYINIFDSPPLQGSLFVTDSLNDRALFSRIVYDKGAYVLHMLRGVFGDSDFFNCIKNYALDPELAYGTATTEDFQGVCEEVSGINLDWFFEEWVYRSDRPEYLGQWSVSGAGPYTTTLNLSQENAAPFKMPLQVHLSGDVMDTVFTIWDSLLFQQFQFVTLEKPTILAIDPDNWVLKFSSVTKVEEDLSSVPKQFKVAQNYPNPFNPKTIITFDLPQNATVTLEIYNVIGQKVYQEIKDFPVAYHNSFIWRGQNNQGVLVPSGMYFYRISTGSNSISKKMVLLR
jgi:aminopeptidase N